MIKRGLVAVGDSITHGDGQPMLGVGCRSWALWLAEALELPYTGLAVDGAVAAGALATQVPRLRGPYDVGCVYLGVNDVRVPSFDVAAFRSSLGGVLEGVGAAADRVLVATIPLALGRPPAPPARIRTANAAIVGLADLHGAALLDLEDLGGWKLVLPDAVHLTAAGQLELARRAARVLGAQSTTALDDPAEGIRPVARYALTGHAAAVVRDGWRRVRESPRWPL